MVIMTHIEINSTIKFKEYIYNFDDTKTYIHTLVSGLRVLRPQHFYKQKISDFWENIQLYSTFCLQQKK